MGRKACRGVAIVCGLIVLGIGRQSLAQAKRARDGFYLRLGAGFGHLTNVAETEPVFGVNAEGTIRGGAAATELAIGGSVARGLALGGGIYSVWLGEPISDNARIADVGIDDDIEFDGGVFAVIGPFIDYYPSPTAGWHVQAALGYGISAVGDGRLDSSNTRVVDEHSTGGFALMFGVGHEWRVSERWGLGVLGRVTAGWLEGENDDDIEWSHRLFAPALLFSATWF